MPSRSDWLLRFIAGTDHYDGWIDRIRVMKGMFLFQEDGHAPRWEVDYKFRPYDYGPFTEEIYRDAMLLIERGLVAEAVEAKAYRVTEAGRRYLSTVQFDPKPLAALIELRVLVSDLSFRELLKTVYQKHPASAARSIAKDVLL